MPNTGDTVGAKTWRIERANMDKIGKDAAIRSKRDWHQDARCRTCANLGQDTCEHVWVTVKRVPVESGNWPTVIVDCDKYLPEVLTIKQIMDKKW